MSTVQHPATDRQPLADRAALARQTLAEARAALERAIAEHPEASPEEIAEARAEFELEARELEEEAAEHGAAEQRAVAGELAGMIRQIAHETLAPRLRAPLPHVPPPRPMPVRRAPRSGRAPRRATASRPASRMATVHASSGDGPPPEPPSRVRPRYAALAAVLCDQRSARELFGWTSKHYIAFLRRRNVRHVIDGRLFVARVADVLSALGLGDAPAAEEPAWSPDDVVRELRAPARRGRR